MSSTEKNILIADDDRRIRDLIVRALKNVGYNTEEAIHGEEALAKTFEKPFDLVILDGCMPKMDGFEVTKNIRDKSDVPIVIVTNLEDEESRIKGYELGADDYVVKPITPRELLLRIQVILKRAESCYQAGKEERSSSSIYTYDDLELDQTAHSVSISDNNIKLSPKEYDLLLYLMAHPEQIHTREELIDAVWGDSYEGNQRTIDTHVKRLRKKIGQYSTKEEKRIETVWGIGYKFNKSLK